MSEETFVIIGAALAGAKAAETLREEGFGGRVVLVGDEPELPYERPPLSKQYLTGEAERDGAHVHPRGFYAEHAIELLQARAGTHAAHAGRRRRAAGGVRRRRHGRGHRRRLDRLRGRRRGAVARRGGGADRTGRAAARGRARIRARLAVRGPALRARRAPAERRRRGGDQRRVGAAGGWEGER